MNTGESGDNTGVNAVYAPLSKKALRMRTMNRTHNIPRILIKLFPVFLFVFLLGNPAAFAKSNLSKTSGESLWPAIGVNSAGEVMVVWTEWSNGMIYYRILRNGQWSAMKNAGIANAQAWSNQMAVDPKGRFHLTWADGYGSHTRDIFYSYWTGNNWSTPEMVHYSPYNSAWNRMDVDNDNSIHVVWYHSNVPKGEPVSSDVVTKSKKFLAKWGTNYQNISRNRRTESIHPAIGVYNGNVYCVWMEDEAPRRYYFCERVGGVWRTPIELRKSGYYPDMATDGSGNIHTVFSLRDGNYHYMSRMGGKWSADTIISNGECPLQFGDITHRNNVVAAAWIQGSDGRWDVYGSAKPVGGRWTIPVKIADADGGGDGNKHVMVALDDKGCAHFVWEGIGTGGRHDIFYEKHCMDVPADATFIEVDNSYLNFHTDDASSNPAAKSFNVRASGKGSINYTITKDKSWISLSTNQGSSSGEWDTVTVNVDASGKADGAYDGTITITDPNAYNSPVEVGVTLTVGEVPSGGGDDGGGGGGETSFLETDKASLDFTMEEGVNPASKSFNLRATGGKILNYTVTPNMPWLSVFPVEGTVGSAWSPISVTVEADGMQPGSFKGRIDINAPGAVGKASVFIHLTIQKKNVPSIQLNKTRFYYWGYAHGSNPPTSLLRIRNSGSKTLNYTISSNKPWVHFSRSKGASTGEWDDITVYADSTSLGVGRHKANVIVAAPGADNSPQNLPVDFEVEMPPQPYPPADVVVSRLNHEGLIIQEYKSKVTWNANARNNGLFNIVKYRIFRKNQYQHNAPWIYIAEVAGNVRVFYEGGFASKQERNQYTYTVASVESGGKESMRADFFGVEGVLAESSPEQKEKNKKTAPDKIKVP